MTSIGEPKYNEETGEWDYFDIEKIDPCQAENTIEWFLDRCEQFRYLKARDFSGCWRSEIETTDFSNTTVDISFTYDYFEYLDKPKPGWKIPKTIFFSNADAKEWIIAEEKKRDDIKKEKERIKQEAEEAKRKIAREEASKQKEINDKLEFERLKIKFGGDNV